MLGLTVDGVPGGLQVLGAARRERLQRSQPWFGRIVHEMVYGNSIGACEPQSDCPGGSKNLWERLSNFSLQLSYSHPVIHFETSAQGKFAAMGHGGRLSCTEEHFRYFAL